MAGFVLPSSTKYLIDDVIGKHQSSLLGPLTLAVIGATAIQGITSFSLTQLLSIEGQKLIAELRRKVQEHIGRLPVTYYDSNKTGQLVSRIMSDVEGMRNLVGTGVIEFVGGLLTAAIGLFSGAADQSADDGGCRGDRAGVRRSAEQGVQNRTAHFPGAGKNQRRSHRASDRSLGGVASSKAITPRIARRASSRVASTGCCGMSCVV